LPRFVFSLLVMVNSLRFFIRLPVREWAVPRVTGPGPLNLPAALRQGLSKDGGRIHHVRLVG
jgi:hypothetical protein